MMKNTSNSEMMTKTIDVTPTWESMVPVLMYIIRRDGDSPKTMKDMEQELRNMAQAADRWNAHCREMR
jgi:hypothetical protein